MTHRLLGFGICQLSVLGFGICQLSVLGLPKSDTLALTSNYRTLNPVTDCREKHEIRPFLYCGRIGSLFISMILDFERFNFLHFEMLENVSRLISYSRLYLDTAYVLHQIYMFFMSYTLVFADSEHPIFSLVFCVYVVVRLPNPAPLQANSSGL